MSDGAQRKVWDDGQYHHFVYVVREGKLLEMYVDGKKEYIA